MTDFKGRREIDVLILSDIHLGTYGCHAKELVSYLKTIKPKLIILNGDIIDIWQFSKKYFPKSHLKVVKQLIHFASKGIPVHYITGNHDEMLRRFAGFQLGNLSIENKLILEVDDKKAWIFHGDVFDVTMQHAKWLTKLGAVGYDILILLNRLTNYILEKTGKEKISLSKKIKDSVKKAVKFINDFEQTCADIAITKKYDYVICGHIHHPEIKTISNQEGSVTYLNSGDWVENLTSLEYYDGAWNIYKHDNITPDEIHEEDELSQLNSKDLFELLIKEINQDHQFQE
ncbi:MAG: UDP-2,3-diacylglucosamine diphosphatase [Bacteroidota bacterium]